MTVKRVTFPAGALSPAEVVYVLILRHGDGRVWLYLGKTRSSNQTGTSSVSVRLGKHAQFGTKSRTQTALKELLSRKGKKGLQESDLAAVSGEMVWLEAAAGVDAREVERSTIYAASQAGITTLNRDIPKNDPSPSGAELDAVKELLTAVLSPSQVESLPKRYRS